MPPMRRVTASFPDLDHARQAMDSLQRGGIEAARIHLSGRAVERAAGRLDTSRRDVREPAHIGSRAILGGLIGLVAGGLIGLVVGLLVFEAGGPAVLGAAVAGAVAGAVVGGMIGGLASADLSEEAELTYEPVKDGRVRVTVSAETEEEIERAEALLGKVEGARIG
jgi:outer membrane lipoprotein SlyB